MTTHSPAPHVLSGMPVAAEPLASHLDRLRAGDEEAYGELVREHGPRMLAVARRMLRNEPDAQDAVQQAFLQAFRSVGHFRGESAISTWLHRIVVNAALMRLRALGRRKESSIEDLLPTYHEDGHRRDASSTPWVDAETLLLSNEVRADVRAAVDRLPEKYRTVIMLRDIEELGTTEVATVLRLTPNAVKIRLHRARQALLTLLTPTLGREGQGRRGAGKTAATPGRRAVRSRATTP